MEGRKYEILEQISMLIDPDDQEELDLFAQIQIDPESDTAADNLIDLLFLLVRKQHDSGRTEWKPVDQHKTEEVT